jgi:hypothetical protein
MNDHNSSVGKHYFGSNINVNTSTNLVRQGNPTQSSTGQASYSRQVIMAGGQIKKSYP